MDELHPHAAHAVQNHSVSTQEIILINFLYHLDRDGGKSNNTKWLLVGTFLIMM